MESQVDAMMPETGITHRSHGPAEWLVLALLVVLWGSAFAALRVSVETIHPAWVVALRSWAAVLVISVASPAMLARGQGHAAEACDFKAIGWFVLIGLAFTTLPVLVFAEASKTEPSAALAICNGASPVFTALLAHRLLAGERMSLRRGAGVALGFAGLLALMAPDLLAGKPVHTMVLLGAIGATLLYAAGNIATRMAPHISAGTSSLIITGSGAVVMTVVALLTVPSERCKLAVLARRDPAGSRAVGAGDAGLCLADPEVGPDVRLLCNVSLARVGDRHWRCFPAGKAGMVDGRGPGADPGGRGRGEPPAAAGASLRRTPDCQLTGNLFGSISPAGPVAPNGDQPICKDGRKTDDDRRETRGAP